MLKKSVVISFIFLFLIAGAYLIFQKEGVTGFSIYSPNESFKCDNCSIILISIDTLRADHLGVYGYGKNTSNNIDAFSKESIVFNNSYSVSAWTFPSHYSMFTSMYPSESEIVCCAASGFDRHTLTDSLKENGYSAAGFIGGGFVGAKYGFNRSFDNYTTNGSRFQDNQEEVYEYIDSLKKDEKFFLFLHGYNAHRPYKAPDESKDLFAKPLMDACQEPIFVDDDNMDYPIAIQNQTCGDMKPGAEFQMSLYDAEIHYLDKFLGELFEKLKEEGLYDNTVIVITSDHGEEFNEHGSFGHVKHLYQESIRVPFIIKIPGSDYRYIETPVSNLDLMPTLLDIIGIEEKEQVDGSSLLPILRGEDGKKIFALTGFPDAKNTTRRTGLVNNSKNRFLYATIQKDGKLIINKETIEFELYNLSTDYVEKNNIIDQNYAYAGILKNDISYWLEEMDFEEEINLDDVDSVTDPEVLEELRALGYI